MPKHRIPPAARAVRGGRRRAPVPSRGTGRVFLVTLGAAVAVGSTMVSLTWALDQPATPLTAAPSAGLAPDTCMLRIDGREQTMDLTAARTVTMITAVSQQVKALPGQAARVLDLALAKQKLLDPNVNEALRLLSKEDGRPATSVSLAAVQSLSRPAMLSCASSTTGLRAQRKGEDGLTERARKVRSGILDAFATTRFSGYGASATRGDGAETTGRALRVALPGSKDATAGWILAHWLVARAESWGVVDVRWADQRWQPTTGWQAVTPLAPAAAPGMSAPAPDRPGTRQLRVVVAKGRG